MKLPIEKWLEEQNFSEEITSLFEESITCYKASAYRAALLFSYLGFQSILKERILKAERPKYIKEEQWKAIKNKLRNDDSWDSEVNECIKRNNDNTKIFNITDDLRTQASYWKYRRNDCAHSKRNTISYSHVESFWLFLFSNLSKFAVDGGVKALLQKIDKHYDQDFTRKDADFSYLIQEVPSAVNEDEIDYFLNQLDEIFHKHDDDYDYPLYYSKRFFTFYNELIKLGLPVSEKTIEFIKGKGEWVEEVFLGAHPEKITFFYKDNESVRNFWRTRLPLMTKNKFLVFASLLRNGLLEAEKEEAIEFFIRNIYTVSKSIPKEVLSDLEFHGYFKQYKELVFNNMLLSNFKWANKEGYKTITEHLDIIGLDVEIVKSINDTFLTSTHPYDMRPVLERYFRDSVKAEKYTQICETLKISPTRILGF
ncbi:hypothetical protein MOB66_07060 [Bacillus haynesii]|uniref:hypothetical protein n=1 Tax=Bacillus haynesii TaxID=1925021 RepID=UPI0022809603|nr:hypothetical protein [Bacillus haynesii]MCY7771229.1 hypothetical protein [Bacillus haynesii]MCY8012213.1 hypothetical protein [Bacillus haynesii]MEC0762632.1 hypothetical protein [Bacillus haynesii]MEC0783462.1 hypothetical protein [Bacillus haynesii]